MTASLLYGKVCVEVRMAPHIYKLPPGWTAQRIYVLHEDGTTYGQLVKMVGGCVTRQLFMYHVKQERLRREKVTANA